MAITTFIVSLCGISGLLAYKAFEIKIKRVHFISNTFEKGDKKIHELIEQMVFKYHRFKKISHIFVFDFLPSYLYEQLVKAKDYVAKKYYTTGDSFRGRRVLRNNGSVSFFLERLSNDGHENPPKKVENSTVENINQ